jgi:hypothetical protein
VIGSHTIHPISSGSKGEKVYWSERRKQIDESSPATFQIRGRKDMAERHPASPSDHEPFFGLSEASTVLTQTPPTEAPTTTILTLPPGPAGRRSAFDLLPHSIAAELRASWKSPCEAAFDHLADRYPLELLRIVQSGNLTPVDLTLAAESVGLIPSGPDVRSCLQPLLKHGDPLVREGALYGLMSHLDEATKEQIRRLAEGDKSWAVRTVAQELLESLS